MKNRFIFKIENEDKKIDNFIAASDFETEDIGKIIKYLHYVMYECQKIKMELDLNVGKNKNCRASFDENGE